MTNKELFLTFFEVESATIIGVKYRDNEKLQLILNPTEKNTFVKNLPIRLLIDVNEHYSRVVGNSEEMFDFFKYLGLTMGEVISVCQEIHKDFGSEKLIVPY
jgi:hypothetical protein